MKYITKTNLTFTCCSWVNCVNCCVAMDTDCWLKLFGGDWFIWVLMDGWCLFKVFNCFGKLLLSFKGDVFNWNIGGGLTCIFTWFDLFVTLGFTFWTKLFTATKGVTWCDLVTGSPFGNWTFDFNGDMTIGFWWDEPGFVRLSRTLFLASELFVY